MTEFEYPYRIYSNFNKLGGCAESELSCVPLRHQPKSTKEIKTNSGRPAIHCSPWF